MPEVINMAAGRRQGRSGHDGAGKCVKNGQVMRIGDEEADPDSTVKCGPSKTFEPVIPGRERSERTRNLEIPGLVLRTIPE
jgi:hypothetical protein